QRNMSPLDHPGHQGQGMKEEANSGHDERGFPDALPQPRQLDQKQSGPQKIEQQRDLEEENVHGPTSPLKFEGIFFSVGIIETAEEGSQANPGRRDGRSVQLAWPAVAPPQMFNA